MSTARYVAALAVAVLIAILFTGPSWLRWWDDYQKEREKGMARMPRWQTSPLAE